MATQGNLGGTKSNEYGVSSTNGYLGFRFTAGGSGSVKVNTSTLKVGGGPASATTHNQEIWSDNAGHPGVKLATGSTYPVQNLTDTTVTSTYTSPATLVGGTAYWLIANHGGTSNNTAYSTTSTGTNHSDRNTTITSLAVAGSGTPPNGEDWYYQLN